MKISIVTPIYNEEKSIHAYFTAIKNLDYPKEDFKILFVNDGSKDNSLKVLKEIKEESSLNIKIVDLEKNLGRAIARERGAKEATFTEILFLDSKCEIFPDALKQLASLKYKAINCNPIQKNKHIFDLFLHIIRKNLYKKNFGENFEDCFITKENFDSQGKGTTMFFCEKTLFLESQLSNKENKNCSDDTKLLWNIVQKTPILKTSKAKCYYNTRSSFTENIKHIFQRGPKFVDYYYSTSKKWFWPINIALLGLITIIYLLIKFNLGIEILFTLIVINTLISLYLAKNIKEFCIVFILFPIFSTMFFAGIIKGLFIKLIHQK